MKCSKKILVFFWIHSKTRTSRSKVFGLTNTHPSLSYAGVFSFNSLRILGNRLLLSLLSSGFTLTVFGITLWSITSSLISSYALSSSSPSYSHSSSVSIREALQILQYFWLPLTFSFKCLLMQSLPFDFFQLQVVCQWNQFQIHWIHYEQFQYFFGYIVQLWPRSKQSLSLKVWTKDNTKVTFNTTRHHRHHSKLFDQFQT